MARDPAQGELFRRPKGFFAVDHRTWNVALSLGRRKAAAYLVMARGTQRNMRTVAWSAASIARYVGVHWYGARGDIQALIEAGLVRQDRAGDYPRYTLMAAHEVPGCIPAAPAPTGKVTALRSVEKAVAPAPERLWLPNEMVDGLPPKREDGVRMPDELSPLRQVLQTGRVEDLRLFVDLYRHHDLVTSGGVPWTQLRIPYDRVQLGQRGAHTVWGFVPGNMVTNGSRELPRTYLTGRIVETNRDGVKRMEDEGWPVFWDALKRLEAMGLIGFVPHVINGEDGDEAGLIHGLGLGGDLAQPEERSVGRAAKEAGLAMLTAAQRRRAAKMIVLPLKRHLVDAQLVGVVRLRFKPHANATAAWLSNMQQCNYWLHHYEGLAAACSVTPRRHQGNIKEYQGIIKRPNGRSEALVEIVAPVHRRLRLLFRGLPLSQRAACAGTRPSVREVPGIRNQPFEKVSLRPPRLQHRKGSEWEFVGGVRAIRNGSAFLMAKSKRL